MNVSGGNFTAYNKVLPGAYVNFVSKTRAMGTIGDRGVVAIPMILNWGPYDEMISVTKDNFYKDCKLIFGCDYTDPQMMPLRDILLGAEEVLVYKLNSGTNADGKIGNLSIEANYEGKAGNSIKIVVSLGLDDIYDVKTYIGNDKNPVASCRGESIGDLKDNKYVTFYGTGDLAAGSVVLSGGQNDAVTGERYAEFLEYVENHNVNTVLYNGSDNTVNGLFYNWVKKVREEYGYKTQVVLYSNENIYNYEGVILVSNPNLLYWVAGQVAGAKVNESLTNKIYNGEYILNKWNRAEDLENYINTGFISTYFDGKNYRILKDINSYIEVSPDKNSDFSNNQVIRVLDTIAMDVAKIFNTYYIGKVQNNGAGRDVFRAELINYHNNLQAIQAIDNFESDNIHVTKGTEKGDVIVDLVVEPVAAMDKLYMSCVII